MKLIFDPAFSKLPQGRITASLPHIHSEPSALDEAALREQLGGRWTTLDTQGNIRKRALRQLWLRKVGQTEQQSRMGVFASNEAVDRKLSNYLDGIAKDHAYTATVLIEFVIRVKAEASIIAPMDFAWLREKDELFWLILNGVGRRRHTPDIVGAFTHHAFEREVKRPVEETFFEGAILHITGISEATIIGS